MARQVIVQPGTSPIRDLFFYVHIDGAAIRPEAKGATDDAIVAELWGAGTTVYKPLLAAYGGFRGWVGQIETKLATKIRRVCLTTWSAGSQVAKDVCLAAMQPEGTLDNAKLPDAITMMDGLYGDKEPDSHPGDGKVVWTPAFEALADYAIAAAVGEKIMVILHSEIPTSYASSAECCAALIARVEAKNGEPVDEVPREEWPALFEASPTMLAPAAGLVSVHKLRNFVVIGFKGQDAPEHIREAHFFDAVWRQFVPWTSKDEEETPDATRAPVSAMTIGPVLKLGDRGERVATLQAALNGHGAKPPLTADGAFGAKTEAAVRAAQALAGLTVTGVADAAFLAALAPIRGIDVSRHQGTIDWSAVARSGVSSFAFVKLTEGATYRDVTGPVNAKAAASARLRVGAYHYFSATTSTPEAQARAFLDAAKDLPLGLPHVLDLEDEKLGDDAGERALAWLRFVEAATGKTPILYTYPSFASSRHLERWPELARYPLWIAHYGVSAPRVPAPWKEWLIWQHTGAGGRCPGVAGDCDLNVARSL